MNPERLQDFPDLTPKEAATLQGAYNAHLQELNAKARAVGRAERELSGLTTVPAEPTGFEGMSIRVYTREYGDACHVVRMVGEPPEGARRPAVLYQAWVRAGNVVITVELGGDLPAADLDATMDRLLGHLSIAAENLAD